MEALEQIFLRVVEAGSLKAAAEQINADPSSISRKIASLEARLKVRLLNRSTSRSTPTEAGQEYYEGLRRLVDEQKALEVAISGDTDTPRGTLCVTAPVDFGTRFVAPVLQTMQVDYPDLRVELLLGSHFEDISSKSIDVAIRIGSLPDSSLICRKLGEVPRVLVASKSYLQENGRPQSPEDLAKHHFIFYSRNQARSPLELVGPEGVHKVQPQGRFTVNSLSAVKALVSSGAGLHLGPLWGFRDEIETGDLEVILPDYRLKAFPLHAVYSSAAYVPAKIRKFIDAMAEQVI